MGKFYEPSLIRRLCHWGPIIALVLIIGLSAGAINLLCHSRMFSETYFYVNLIPFCFEVTMLFFSYLRAIGLGPGYTPESFKDVPANIKKKVQFCHLCNSYKPPRAHHCRVCNRCTLKMDHHCPWINNCVGHKNHKSFLLFLLYVMLTTTHGMVICFRHTYAMVSHFGFHLNVIIHCFDAIIVFVLAGAVCLALTILAFFQMKSILLNQTEVESWICKKADYRRKDFPNLKPFTYPYFLGYYTNWKTVMGDVGLWQFPTESPGNGVKYDVSKNCTEYDLTIEQIEQKKEKREQMTRLKISKSYNGAMITCSFGWCVFFRTPSCDSPRLSVETGDIVDVSRIEKYWLYGEKARDKSGRDLTPAERAVQRGWLVRKCVEDDDDDDDDSENKKKKD